MILPHLASLLESESIDRARLLASIASSLGLAAVKPFTSGIHKLIVNGKRKRRYAEIAEANTNLHELKKLQESGLSEGVESLRILVSQRAELLIGELQSLEAAERRRSSRRAGTVTKLRRLTLWFTPTTTKEWLVHSLFYFWCFYFLWNVESAISFALHLLEHGTAGGPMRAHPFLFVLFQLTDLVYTAANAFVAVYIRRYALYLRRSHETGGLPPVQNSGIIGWTLAFIACAWLADVLSLLQYAAFFNRTVHGHGFSFFWHISSPLRVLLQVLCLAGIWLFLWTTRKGRAKPAMLAEQSSAYSLGQETGT